MKAFGGGLTASGTGVRTGRSGGSISAQLAAIILASCLAVGGKDEASHILTFAKSRCCMPLGVELARGEGCWGSLVTSGVACCWKWSWSRAQQRILEENQDLSQELAAVSQVNVDRCVYGTYLTRRILDEARRWREVRWIRARDKQDDGGCGCGCGGDDDGVFATLGYTVSVESCSEDGLKLSRSNGGMLTIDCHGAGDSDCGTGEKLLHDMNNGVCKQPDGMTVFEEVGIQGSLLVTGYVRYFCCWQWCWQLLLLAFGVSLEVLLVTAREMCRDSSSAQERYIRRGFAEPVRSVALAHGWLCKKKYFKRIEWTSLVPCALLLLQVSSVSGQHDIATVSPVNFATIGSSTITIGGSSFGSVDISPMARVGGSACEATVWVSDGSLTCRLGSGVGSNRVVSVTIANNVSTAVTYAGALTYDAPNLASVSQRTNLVTSGGSSVTISGSGFGAYDYTSQTRSAGSACAASTWHSDTSIVCKAAAGLGTAHYVSVTAATAVGTTSQAVSYDAPLLRGVPANAPTYNEIFLSFVSLNGTGFGTYSPTSAGRLGGSACQSTTWASDSAIRCLATAGTAATHSAVITVADRRLATITQLLSYDTPSARSTKGANIPRTGGGSITIVGSNFGQWDGTISARMGGTACEASTWIADSSIVCKSVTFASQERPYRALAVTLGVNAGGSLTQAWTYDNPQVVGISPSNCAVTGRCTTTIIGVGFGSADSSVRVRFGSTACETTPWFSQTSIACQVPGARTPGIGASPIVATISLKVVTLQTVFTYDSPRLIGGTLGAWDGSSVVSPSTSLTLPSTEGGVVAFGGMNLISGNGANVTAVTLGTRPGFDSYPCDLSLDSSTASQIVCTVAPGVGFGLRLKVVVNGREFVATDALNYPGPIHSSGMISIYGGSGSSGATEVVGTTTAGGVDIVELHGNNFGAVASDLSVVYGLNGSPEYRCDVQFCNHTLIRCATQSGSGTGYKFNVSVGRQWAISTDTFSYPPPFVTSLSVMHGGGSSGSNGVGSTTVGGVDAMILAGGNFGPDARHVKVWYSSSVSSSGRLWCSVMRNGTKQDAIKCLTSSGSGAFYTVTVMVRGQSAPVPTTFHYPPPVLRSASLRIVGTSCVSPTRCYTQRRVNNKNRPVARSTIGGIDLLEMDGTNFGPDSLAATVTLGKVVGGSYVASYTCSMVSSGGFALNHTRLQCIAPSGIGTGYVFQVNVSGQVSGAGSDVLSYPDPDIFSGTLRATSSGAAGILEYNPSESNATSVRGNLSIAGEYVEFYGRNFGPEFSDATVTYGPLTNPAKYSCARLSVAGTWSQSSIRCALSPGSGKDLIFVVTVSTGQQSRVGLDSFSYPPPSTTASSLRYACGSGSSGSNIILVEHTESSPGSTTVSVTEGPANETCMAGQSAINATGTGGGDLVRFDGNHFGPLASDVRVTYTRDFFPFTYVAEVLAEGFSETSITVRTQAGLGRNHIFAVSVSGQVGFTSDVYNYPLNKSLSSENVSASTTSLFSASLTTAVAGISQAIYLQTKDLNGTNLLTGGASFLVDANGIENRFSVNVTDQHDGVYSVLAPFTRSGSYTLSVQLLPELLHVQGSPFTVSVVANPVVSAQLSGINMPNTVQTAGVSFAYVLLSRDVYGNEITGIQDLFYADARAPSLISQNESATTEPSPGSRISAKWTLTVSGQYSIKVWYNGTELQFGFSPIFLFPGVDSPNNAVLLSPSSRSTDVETVVSFSLRNSDVYGNVITQGGARIVASIIQSVPVDLDSIKFVDAGSGDYTILVRITITGSYTIAVGLGDIGRTYPFSPLSLDVAPGNASAPVSTIAAIESVTAGEAKDVVIYLTDKYGNVVPEQASSPALSLYSTVGGVPAFANDSSASFLNNSGAISYAGSIYTTKSGTYLLAVTHQSQDFYRSPFTIEIIAAAIDRTKCTAQQTLLTGDALFKAVGEGVFAWSTGPVKGGTRNSPFYLIITAKDTYENPTVNTQTSLLTVSSSPSFGIIQPTSLGFSAYLSTITNPTSSMFVSIKYDGVNIGPTAGGYTANVFTSQAGISAANSYLFGAPRPVAGVTSYFYIQAVDTQNIPMAKGGSSFEFSLVSSPADFNSTDLGQLVSATDSSLGWYSVAFTPTRSGMYSVDVSLSAASVAQSPIEILAYPASISAQGSTLYGSGLTLATSGSSGEFFVQARDTYGNLLGYDPRFREPFEAVILGGSSVVAPMTYFGNGTGSVSYHITVSGEYSVQVRTISSLGSGLVGGVAKTLLVRPLDLNPNSSFIYGADSGVSCVAGSPARVILALRDKYNNPTPNASVSLDVSVSVDQVLIPASANVSKEINEDQTVSILFTVTRSGSFVVSVNLGNGTIVANTSLSVSASEPFANNSIVSMLQQSPFRVDQIVSLQIISVDVYGNNISTGGASFSATMSPSDPASAAIRSVVTDWGNGTYVAQFGTLRLGNYTIQVSLVGFRESLPVWEAAIRVIRGFMSPITSLPVSLQGLDVQAGTPAVLNITARDSFFNPTDNRDGSITATAIPAHGSAFLTVFDVGTSVIVTLNTTRSGEYAVSVFAGSGVQLASSPFNFIISPSAIDPSLVTFSGGGLTAAVAGSASSYAIEVRDRFGNLAPGSSNTIFPPFVMTLAQVGGSQTKNVDVTDSFNSSYQATYLITTSGIFSLSISYSSSVVTGFPINVTVFPTTVDASASSVTQIAPLTPAAGDTLAVNLQSRDYYGNNISIGGTNFTVELFQIDSLAAQQVGVVMADGADGTYSFSSLVTKSGDYFLGVFLGDNHVFGSPARISVSPGAANAGASNGDGPGLVSGRINTRLPYSIYVRDVFGNNLASGYAGAVVATYTFPGRSAVVESLSQDVGVETAIFSAYTEDSQVGNFSVEITVAGSSIAGSPFLVQLVTAVTGSPDASKCYAQGVGLSSATAGSPASFVIQAVDSAGLLITNGGALFVSELVRGAFIQVIGSTDNGDGTYGVSLDVTASGTYTLAINTIGVSISGSPFTVDVFPAVTNAQSSSLSGHGLTAGTAGLEGSFLIQARDRFSNVQRFFFGGSASTFGVSVVGPVSSTATMTSVRDSTFVAKYAVTVAGNYLVFITVSGTPSLGPINLRIYPGEPSATNSMLAGVGASSVVAGDIAQFRWRPSDAFGNLILASTTTLPILNFSPPSIASPTVANDGTGTILATYLATVGGTYRLSVSLPGTSVDGTGWNVTIGANVFDSSSSTATGLGVSLDTAGILATFTVVARDRYSNLITKGFTFTTLVKTADGDFRASCLSTTYFCNYMVTRSGSLTVSVLKGANHVSGSPFPVKVNPSYVDTDKSATLATSLATAGQDNTFFIVLKDRYENQLTDGGRLFSVKLSGRDIIVVPPNSISDGGDGTYAVSYFASVSGSYSLAILSQSLPIAQSPINMTISSGLPSPAVSSLLFQQLVSCGSSLCGTVDAKHDMVISLRDAYNNPVDANTYDLVLLTEVNGLRRYGFVSKSSQLGDFVGFFSATVSGTYKISVSVAAVEVGGSPLTAYIASGKLIDSGSILLSGSSLTLATAGSNVPFTMQARDVFSNSVFEPTFASAVVAAVGPEGNLVSIGSNLTRSGTEKVSVDLTITRSGAYSLSLTLLAINAVGTPLILRVRPGPIHAPSSDASGSGAKGSEQNKQATIIVTPRDRFGNVAAFQGSLFQTLKGNLLYPGRQPEPMQVFLQSTSSFPYELPSSAEISSTFALIYFPRSASAGVYAEVTIDGVGIKDSPIPVTISFGGGIRTATSNSFATGQGISSSTAGSPASFTIQAADASGLWLSTGGAKFTASTTFVNSFRSLTVTDKENGEYAVTLDVTASGTYTLTCMISSSHIVGSPFSVRVFPGGTSALASSISGVGMSSATAGVEGFFIVQARDSFYNVQRYFFGDGSSLFSFTLKGPSSKSAIGFSALRDSSYVVTYNVTTSGTYTASLKATEDPTPRTWTFQVEPSAIEITQCRISASDLAKEHVAGANLHFKIMARDGLGNLVAAPAVQGELTNFQAYVRPDTPATIKSVDGSFTVVANVTCSGSYSLSVFIAAGIIPGSPYSFRVMPSRLSVATTRVSGEALGGGKAGVGLTIIIYPRDSFGNTVELSSDSQLQLSLDGRGTAASVSVSSIVKQSGRIIAQYVASRPCSSCLLSVVVQGQHVSGSPFEADFVPSDPPRITQAIFNFLLTAADVTFDVPTNRHGKLGSIFSCDIAFDAATTAAAGDGPKCLWSSDAVLSLIFGSGSQLLPGSSLVLARGTSLQNAFENSFNSTGSAVLRLPSQIQAPSPVIMGPATVGACDALTLDASQSTGGGGRTLRFLWGLELGPSNRESIVTGFSTLDPASDSITLAPATILQGETYNFSLILSDVFGQRVAAYHRVTATALPTPVVSIVSIPTKKLSRSLALTLNGQISLPSCGSSTSADLFWESVGGPIFPIRERTRRSSTISVAANTLVAGGTYTVRLIGSFASSAASFADVSFTVENTPLVAAIRGGDRTVSASQPLVLDASVSVDPDDEPGSPSYTWQCSPSPCFADAQNILLESGPLLIVPPSQLSVDANYTFTVSFFKDPGPRQASATALISVVADNVAQVSFAMLQGARAKVNSVDRLVLVGSVTSPSGECQASYSWRSWDGLFPIANSSVRTTDITSPNLVLVGGTLVRGSTYTFELRGTCVGTTEEGVSRMAIVVNSPPVGGTFVVSPPTGSSAQTLFKLACSGWVDDATDLPISYQFSALRVSVVGARQQPLTRRVLMNKVHVLLPGPSEGGSPHSVSLSVQVCDSVGECTSLSDRIVTVVAPTLPSSQLIDVALSAALGVGNIDSIFQLGTSVALLLNQAAAGDDVSQRSKLVGAFNDASHTVDLSPDMVSIMAYGLDAVLDSPTQKLTAMHDTSLALLASLANAATTAGINGSAASSILGGLSGVSRSADLGLETNTSRRVLTPGQVFDRISDVSRDVGRSLLVGRVSYESRVTVSNGDLRQTVWRLAKAQVGGSKELSYPCDGGLPCTAVRMPLQWTWRPSILDTQVLSWGPRLRHVEAGSFLSAPITTVLAMDGANVVEGKLGDGFPLFVDLYVSPSTVAGSTGAAEDDKIATCEYWNATLGRWSKWGCIAFNSNASLISCACYHLSDFTSLIRPTAELPTLTIVLPVDKDLFSPRGQEGFGAAVVGFTAIGTILLALLAHLFDRFQVRRFQPDLATELLGPEGGYVQAIGVGKVKKNRFGLFLGLLGGTVAHLMKRRHGIVSIIFWTPRDPYTRTPRVVALLLHVGSCMVLSILLMSYAGFTDSQSISCGIITSIILLPLHPILTASFRSIAPRKFKDRGEQYARKRPFTAEGENPVQMVQGVILEDEAQRMDAEERAKAKARSDLKASRTEDEDEDEDEDVDGNMEKGEGTGLRREAALEPNSISVDAGDLEARSLKPDELSGLDSMHHSRVKGQGRDDPAPPSVSKAEEIRRRMGSRDEQGEYWGVGQAFGAWVSGGSFGGGYVPPSRAEMQLPDLDIQDDFLAPRRPPEPSATDASAGGRTTSQPTPAPTLERLNTEKLPDESRSAMDGDGGVTQERPRALPPVKKWVLKTDKSVMKIPSVDNAKSGRPFSAGMLSPFRNAVVPEGQSSDGSRSGDGSHGDDRHAQKLPRVLFVAVYLASALYYLECALICSLHSFDMSESTKSSWVTSIIWAFFFHFVIVEPLAYLTYGFVTIRKRLVDAAMG